MPKALSFEMNCARPRICGQERGRSVDMLWTGTAVQRVPRCGASVIPVGSPQREEAFATAMVQHAERRQRRRRFAVVAGFALALTVMAVFAALWQRSVAETQRAEASKLLALGQLEIERYPSAAVAYGLKSLELADTLEARLFALRALQQGPTALTIPNPPGLERGRGWAHVVRFSPNGKWLAVGGYDWLHIQAQNGGAPFLLRQFPTVGYQGAMPAFSPSGDHLAAIKSGETRFWSVPDFEEIGGAKNEEGPSGLFATDDDFCGVTRIGNERLFRRWSLDGTRSQVVGRMQAFTAALDIDRKGRCLAYGTGHRILIRSLDDWEQRPKVIGEHPADVRDVTFRPDGRQLATNDSTGEIRLWSLDSKSKEPVRVLDGGGLRGLVFDDSGDLLAAFGRVGSTATVRLWNLKGPVDAEPTILKREDSLGVLINGAAFDPSGRWLATGHAFSVALWPVGNRLPVTLTGHKGHVDAVAFTPDRKHLVSVAGDGTVRLWSLESGDASRVIFVENLVFPTLAMDPAGKFVVVSGRSSVFVVPLDGGPSRELEGFSSAAITLRVALDSKGRLVAAAAVRGPVEDKVIRIWDLESEDSWTLGPMESAGDGVQGGFGSLAFLPDGRLVSDGVTGLHLWDVESGHLKTLSEAPAAPYTSCDGEFVLREEISDSGRRLVRFDIERGVSDVLSSHGNKPSFHAFDPSGRLAISTGADGVVRVGPVTGEDPHLIYAHEGLVRSATVSPNGRWIASGGEDGRIRLLPMPDMEQQPLHTLPHEDLLTRLRALTNVRVVEDEASSTGYQLDYAPFPGWEKVPEW